MKNLYKLTTRGLGDFFVVGCDPTQAINELNSRLNKDRYGFSDDRIVIKTEFLSKEIDKYPTKTHRLILS